MIMDYLIPQPERQSFVDKLYKLFLEDIEKAKDQTFFNSCLLCSVCYHVYVSAVCLSSCLFVYKAVVVPVYLSN